MIVNCDDINCKHCSENNICTKDIINLSSDPYEGMHCYGFERNYEKELDYFDEKLISFNDGYALVVFRKSLHHDFSMYRKAIGDDFNVYSYPIIYDETIRQGTHSECRYYSIEGKEVTRYSSKDKELIKASCDWLRENNNVLDSSILSSIQKKMISQGMNI